MAVTNLPSPEELRQLLDYDPETGVFTWRERTPEMFEDGGHSREHICARWNALYAGKQAIHTPHIKGYRSGHVNRKGVLAHRAAYAMMTGHWPPDQIDHINGDKTDNRWANLRAVSNTENHRNMPRRSDNTSGDNGVYWYTRLRKWEARVGANGRSHFLGYFSSKEDAIAARARADLELGFTNRHGKAA